MSEIDIYDMIALKVRKQERELEKLKKELKDYKSRIEKVVEYIDRRDIEWGSEQHEYLLNILNGRSDE